jgi:hypothetical protein
VIGDVHDGPLPAVQELVAGYGPAFSYLAFDAGHHCYGHCQLNRAMWYVKGKYVHVNDDDDVWAPDAVETMRSAAGEHPGKPLLFRFKSYHGPIFWNTKGRLIRHQVGGHCLVTPANRAGSFTCDYTGDFDWVMTSVMQCGGVQTAVWIDKVVCYARPT